MCLSIRRSGSTSQNKASGSSCSHFRVLGKRARKQRGVYFGTTQVAIDQQDLRPNGQSRHDPEVDRAGRLAFAGERTRDRDRAQRTLGGDRVDSAPQRSELLGHVRIGLEQRDPTFVHFGRTVRYRPGRGVRRGALPRFTATIFDFPDSSPQPF